MPYLCSAFSPDFDGVCKLIKILRKPVPACCASKPELESTPIALAVCVNVIPAVLAEVPT